MFFLVNWWRNKNQGLQNTEQVAVTRLALWVNSTSSSSAALEEPRRMLSSWQVGPLNGSTSPCHFFAKSLWPIENCNCFNSTVTLKFLSLSWMKQNQKKSHLNCWPWSPTPGAAFSLLSPKRKTNTNIRKLYSIDIDNIRKPQMVYIYTFISLHYCTHSLRCYGSNPIGYYYYVMRYVCHHIQSKCKYTCLNLHMNYVWIAIELWKKLRPYKCKKYRWNSHRHVLRKYTLPNFPPPI